MACAVFRDYTSLNGAETGNCSMLSIYLLGVMWKLSKNINGWWQHSNLRLIKLMLKYFNNYGATSLRGRLIQLVILGDCDAWNFWIVGHLMNNEH